MPSFEVGPVTENGANITVYTGGYSWFRIFVRLLDEQSAFFDEYFNEPQDFSTYVAGLSAGTSYAVNIRYGNSRDTCTNIIGLQTFQTLNATESEDGTVWINGSYYQPYIYNGRSWQRAIPYIYLTNDEGIGNWYPAS